VRVSESSCPFCGVALDDSFRSRPAPRAPAGRLNRAALYALGAAGTFSAAIACGGAIQTGEQADGGGAGLDGGGTKPGLDGGRAFDSAIQDSTAIDGTIEDSGLNSIMDTAYGGPYPFDTSPRVEDSGLDSTIEDSGPNAIFDTAYGGPVLFDSGMPDMDSDLLPETAPTPPYGAPPGVDF
jgi:hypothetical protein